MITGLGIGGAEHALCRLLESLPASDIEHHVIALGADDALSARVDESAETLTHLNIKARMPNPLTLLRLRRLLRSIRPDVVHGWMYHGNIAASTAGANLDVPVIWGIRQSLYNLDHEKRLTRVIIRLGALLSARPKRIVYNASVSAAQHARLGYCSDRARVIPNGFDTERFRPDHVRRARVRAELGLSRNAFVIGFVARWHPMKDHETFLRAARLFNEVRPEAVFMLVGNGVDHSNVALSASVSRHGLSSRMWLCGERHDMESVNAALDIASSSSAWGEAFPNAMGEAMACGVPCAATDVGDVKKILGDAGIVVPPRNPRALCDAWLELADMDPTSRIRLGARARRRVFKHYALRAMSRQYAALYRELKVE